RGPRGVLRIEYDHRQPVLTLTVRTSPVARHDARQLLDARNDLFLQPILGCFTVVDRDRDDNSVHARLLHSGGARLSDRDGPLGEELSREPRLAAGFAR